MTDLRLPPLFAAVLAACSILSPAALAEGPPVSPDGLWRSVDPSAAVATLADTSPDLVPWEGPPDFRLIRLDPVRLRGALGRAAVGAAPLGAEVTFEKPEITLPLPDGGYARFWIVESQILSPGLAAKFPDIKTYRGQGIDDPAATVQIDTSSEGMHVQILYPGRVVIVDPFHLPDQLYASFDKSRVPTPNRFDCEVHRPEAAARSPLQEEGAAARTAGSLLTYRVAVAATAEYTAAHGGTRARAMRGIATTITRVSGIYERELALQLQLVDDNDELIFTDPASDRLSNDNAIMLIAESQALIDRVIGSANYDLGHTVSTGAGGRASLGVACREGMKARGVTGSAQPFGDAFDVDYVAHEMGHQLGGDHTFNGSLRSCASNRNQDTAFEPGSGSTIQAYAGICGDDNLQANSHAYFHSVSLDQMLSYLASPDGACGSELATGNRPPVVSAGPDRVVPRGTPFTLAAAGTDPDQDPLTFCWEERDLGPQSLLSAADDGQIPLFRSLEPSTSPQRTFPRLVDILSGSSRLGETRPQQNRTMTFRVTARDNRVTGGAVGSDDVRVTVHAGAGPFEVTSPGGGTLQPGPTTVTWKVAGTKDAPVSTDFVNILLSTDGGMTYDFTLARNTSNDGSEVVQLPAISSPLSRIKVEAAGNIFFAVSPANFRIEPAQERAAAAASRP